ncbi:hypothetical protein [Xenococcus sp. PCC 7305]|uniref:hypothetical protein n=1 Tax=Xenococcus sp. PCC 7305 TaxID=102125 RepID=UPI0005930C72|nr:hypothetical protein [Xenococcus sp. PCC 7305]
MVNEQHEMIITQEKFLIFRQLRVRDFEATERFLLYGKSPSNCSSLHKDRTFKTVDLCHKIHR